MENASKAFIMAAGVLIAVMIASFMILVLRKAGSMSAEYETQRGDLELANFNSQFEYFARDDNTYFDIMTVSNMAYDVNRNNGYDANNNVIIKLCLNLSNETITHSIKPASNLKRNYFFPKEDDTTDKEHQIYMYKLVSEDGNTELEDVLENGVKVGEKYKYRFRCIKTDYNKTTGKISEMIFKKEKNN